MKAKSFFVLIAILYLCSPTQAQIFGKKFRGQFPSRPYGKPVYETPFQPRVGQPQFQVPLNIDEGDLQNFIEDTSEQKFRHCVDDVDVDIDCRRRCMEIEIEARTFQAYLQVQNYIRSMPQVAGFHLTFINRDLEDMLENSIELRLGRCVDSVSVDVDERRRCIEIELELRHFVPYGQVRQAVATLPEVQGYTLRLEVEIDD